jgi:hypothetical protein
VNRLMSNMAGPAVEVGVLCGGAQCGLHVLQCQDSTLQCTYHTQLLQADSALLLLLPLQWRTLLYFTAPPRCYCGVADSTSDNSAAHAACCRYALPQLPSTRPPSATVLSLTAQPGPSQAVSLAASAPHSMRQRLASRLAATSTLLQQQSISPPRQPFHHSSYMS